MDPDVTLGRLRELVELFRVEEPYAPTEAYELAEKVEQLDAWMTNGGFLPTAWDTGRDPHPSKRNPHANNTRAQNYYLALANESRVRNIVSNITYLMMSSW